MAAVALFPLPAKRKRDISSYAEGNDELDELLDDGQSIYSEDEQDVEDLDADYGSRKKAIKKRKTNKKKGIAPSKIKKPKKPFRFLDLPPELRDQIYELAFTEDCGIYLMAKFKGHRRTVARSLMPTDEPTTWPYDYERVREQQVQREQAFKNRIKFIPALLAVNKQIYSEAIDYLYKQPIVLENTKALHHFLAGLGDHRARLQNLTVQGWGNGRGIEKASNFAALTMMSGCTNLKSFIIDSQIGWNAHPKGLARQLFRDGCYFFEALGAAQGKKDAILDVLRLKKSNYHDGWKEDWRNGREPVKGAFRKQFSIEMRKLLGCLEDKAAE